MKKVSLSFAWRPTGVSFCARALSRERGIQLQFAADSFCMMTIPPSFLVKDNAKTFFFFFAKMMKMMKAILAAVWHLLDKYSFATPDLYFLLPKFSSLLMRVGGGRGESLSWENNNINEHVSKCRGIFTKDNVTQPLQKTRPDYCGKWQHAIRHSCNYHLKILLLSNVFIQIV